MKQHKGIEHFGKTKNKQIKTQIVLKFSVSTGNMSEQDRKLHSSGHFVRPLKVKMRAPIGFSWQGLVWAEKLFTEEENDGQFPAVKLSGRSAAKTHPGQNSRWHQQREQNGERNADTEKKRESLKTRGRR